MLDSARAHLEAADILASGGKYGFAVAHLVYALEESEKGRTLAKVVLGDALSDEEIYRALYHHAERHVGALMKSWSSGAAVMDLMAEGLRERIGVRPERTEQERYDEVISRYPEVLPEDWPETAGATREQSLYVDLGEGGWASPLRADSSAYERLRPAVATLLDYFSAAYQREIVPIASSASRR